MKTEWEKRWGAAHNLVCAYEDLKNIRELFKTAKEAEAYLTAYEKKVEQKEKDLAAVTKAIDEMDSRYSEKVKDVKIKEAALEGKLIRIEQEFRDKLQSEYGKKAENLKREIYNLEKKLVDLKADEQNRYGHLNKVNGNIRIREQHLDKLDEQMKNIQEAFTK